MPGDGAPAPRVPILADDLIWSTRLAALLRQAGAEPVVCRGLAAFGDALPATDRAVVDLTLRADDPLAAIRLAAADGRSVLCVGQHDDLDARRAALAAGAWRVFAYRKLADDGPRVIRGWLVGEDEPPGRGRDEQP